MAKPTLTQGEAERLRREILAELADDYVGLWEVAWMVATELGSEDAAAVRENTMRLVEGMLLRGLIRPGLAREDGGFDPWPTGPEDFVLALKERWDAVGGRLPTLGEIAWFDSTPRGQGLCEGSIRERRVEALREIGEGEWLNAASSNPVFAFLYDPKEDVYGPEDGEPYREEPVSPKG